MCDLSAWAEQVHRSLRFVIWSGSVGCCRHGLLYFVWKTGRVMCVGDFRVHEVAEVGASNPTTGQANVVLVTCDTMSSARGTPGWLTSTHFSGSPR